MPRVGAHSSSSSVSACASESSETAVRRELRLEARVGSTLCPPPEERFETREGPASGFWNASASVRPPKRWFWNRYLCVRACARVNVHAHPHAILGVAPTQRAGARKYCVRF